MPVQPVTHGWPGITECTSENLYQKISIPATESPALRLSFYLHVDTQGNRLNRV